jgi:hypothetical protein
MSGHHTSCCGGGWDEAWPDLTEHGTALDSYLEIDLAHPSKRLNLRHRYCSDSSDEIGVISCLSPLLLLLEVAGFGLVEGVALVSDHGQGR